MTRQDAAYAHDVLSATLSGKEVYYTADGKYTATELPTLPYLSRKAYVVQKPFEVPIVPCTLYHEAYGAVINVVQFVRKYSADGSVAVLVESETGELHPVLEGSLLRRGAIRLNLGDVIVTRVIIEGAE